MEMKLLTGDDIQKLLRVANAMGRGVHAEITETYPNTIEGTIVQIMVAELQLVNVMNYFAKTDPVGGLQAFNNLHTAIQQAIVQSNILAGGQGATGNS